MDLTVVTFNQRPDLFDQQEQICGRAFPEFLYYSDTAAAFWEKMISFHDAFQFMLLEQDQVAAVINCLPMDLDMPLGALPDNAFDWAFEKSIKDYEDGKKLNAAVGVQIVVSEAYGTIARLEPLGRNPVEEVSEFERTAYGRFVTRYSNYWSQFFDPIAIRLDRLDDSTSELTTFILPLPESALFNQVRESLANHESGQQLRVPVMTPEPTMVFSLNLSDDLRLSLSEGLAERVDIEAVERNGERAGIEVRDQPL